nr:DUF2950 domain-containing protein [uncultured Rhodopila sp.]
MTYALRPWLFGALFAAGLSVSAHAAPAAAPQQVFASPDDAVAALVKAEQAGDEKALRGVFGPGSEKLVSSGDRVADAAGRQRFLDSYAAAHSLTPQEDGSVVLTIGPNAWPMPIPLVKADNGWRFDAATGAQQIIDRRIGRNELLTIRTLLASVEAEKDYFDRVQRGTGTGVYTDRFFSTPGQEDGLYWEPEDGEAASPLAPLIDQARDEGYPGAASPAGKQEPYHGYFFRILKAQGPNAPGGAKSYLSGGKMTGGFALLAWPAAYESGGVMTFVVDQDGVVFQKDLGAATAKIAAGITRFDPDVTWARVDISD